MAFNLANLTRAFDGAPVVYDYSTADNTSTVEASGYFTDVRFFRTRDNAGGIGDTLRISAGDGKSLYLILGEDSSVPGVNLRKLASGVTSFVNSISGP